MRVGWFGDKFVEDGNVWSEKAEYLCECTFDGMNSTTQSLLTDFYHPYGLISFSSPVTKIGQADCP